MKNNSIIVFFAILVLANLVYGQSGSSTTSSPATTVPAAPTTTAPLPSIASCISQYCVATASDYLDCRAKCAGVPNPSESDIDKTNSCLAKCNQTSSDYESCREECLGNYYTTSAVFTTSTPNTNKPNTNGPTGSGGPNPSEIPTTTATPSATSSSNSFISQNLYSLILLGICMVAGILGIGL
ncbi:10490_t:CDS:2 [Diversispora eburnea]|uniref:10490_t:CDS:1 n=1 Tax=Diversispora eburnea TaxID=1213867 RepID=A0A9N8VPG3_9GLOM|nr:10490_t:CDS:2 [Diversispora eburnea]